MFIEYHFTSRRGQDTLHPDAFSSNPPLDVVDIMPGSVGQLRDGYSSGSPPRYDSPQRIGSRSARKPSRLADAVPAAPGADSHTAMCDFHGFRATDVSAANGCKYQHATKAGC